ncbi:unnamed protein product [Cuscuta campestris]|uniref:Uncharacterized protein n=1 Tax=Cuscuta campestris TaxID=132261 RepID=A0A484KGK2_9ASTE|nr:unnamed protein product [Cuscuta campestris]
MPVLHFLAGIPMNFLGLGAGGGCGIGVGLGWGFGTAFGSQYRNSRVSFELHGSKAGAQNTITRKAGADDDDSNKL